MSSHPFDQLVCLRVLQFTHQCDWATNQPFLISKTFNQVFNSDGFTRDFLMRNLDLDQIDELQQTIDVMKNKFVSEKKPRPKTTKKKKRKFGEKSSESNVIERPMNLRDVLKLYVKCSGSGDDVIVKNRVTELMEKFTKSKDVSLLDSALEKLTVLKSGVGVQQSYEDIGSEGVSFYVGTESHEIPSEIMPKLFKKLKGAFVLETSESNWSEEKVFNTKVVVFLNCGYPLMIETVYEDRLDSYRSSNFYLERVSIFGAQVFEHSKKSSQHGHFDTEYSQIVSRSLLKNIQDMVFTSDISTILQQENELKDHPQQAIKEGLIYQFFQIAFGEKASDFLSNSDEWIPFRHQDDDYDDDEEIDEEDANFIDDEEVDDEETEKANETLEKMGYKRKRDVDEDDDEEEDEAEGEED